VRHLIRGLPEGALFGIEKARGKNPIKKRHRAEDRMRTSQVQTAGEPAVAYTGERKVALMFANAVAGAGTLAVVVAGGYLLIHLAELPSIAPHLVGSLRAFRQVGSFFSRPLPGIGKPIPGALRDAFSLSSPQEDVGRMAGIASHASARSFTRGARRARFEEMVQGYIRQIRQGALDRSHPWRGTGAAIHEAAERIAAGLA
jgi:hypothetical protein